jgi:hypothetical protein
VLRAGVAVSLRAAGQPVEPGNRTGAIMVRLPLDEADPRVRLRQMHTECAAARSTQVSTVAGSVMLQLARVGLLRPASRHQRLTNIVESDVIGPREPLHLLGARVTDLIPIGNLAGNLSIAFLALSYLDGLVITVQADADQFPDLATLMEAMQQDWSRIEAGARPTDRDRWP